MFLQDLQYGVRQLIRSPGFLIVSVLSLALGIGANTAIFSLLNSVLLKKLAVREPEKLVILSDPSSSGVFIGSTDGERSILSYPEFLDLKRSGTLFSGICAVESNLSRTPARIDGVEEEVTSKLVSGSYFSVLGVQPQAGRFFSENSDSQIGAVPYVVISDNFWERRFARSPNAIGKTIVMSKTPLTVIGIAPPTFLSETVGQRPDLFAPLSMQLQLKPGRDWLHPLPDPTEKAMWLHAFARLKPGVTLAQADAQANVIFKRNLEESYQSVSAANKKQFMDQKLKLREAATGASDLRDRFKESIYVLLAAVGITLLICCANLTNLLLARANARQREITVRLALGASKSQVTLQLLAESLLLALLGAAFGLLLAQAATPLLIRMASSPNDPIGLDSRLDWRVLCFTGGVAILTTLLLGLAPALRAARTDVNATLREGSRGMTATASRLRLGKIFVATQVALSLILLVGAGLLLRTLMNLQDVSLGYTKENLSTIRVDGAGGGYSDDKRPLLYKRVLDELRTIPGAQVTDSANGLFAAGDSGDRIAVEGYSPKGENDRGARWDQIGSAYFSTIGIPVLQGREINDTDQKGSPLVCVINDAFRKLFFANRNPLGKHIKDTYGDNGVTFEIIGVAADSRDHNLRGKVPPRFFISLAQNAMNDEPDRLSYLIRSATPPGATLAAARRAVARVDRDVPIAGAQTIGEAISTRVGQDRMLANLTTAFGSLALLLAAIGIYGVLAYGVSQRTSEIGIRMAVGAGTGHVIRMILRETGVMVVAGLAAGLVGSFWLSQLIRSRLVGLEPTDPLVLTCAVSALLALGFVAALAPAWRAAKIDPADALRCE